MSVFKMHTGSIINGEVKMGDGRKSIEVRFPFNQELVGIIDQATLKDIEEAIQGAHKSFISEISELTALDRSKILNKAAAILAARKEEMAEILTLEVGKPIKDSLGEVGRAIQVLEFSADEAKSIGGHTVPMDAAVGGNNRIGIVEQYPLGVVLAITPFNFPLNLALHKIGPAIAAGNTVVIKPAEKTPLSTVLLHEIFVQAGLPANALQVVMGEGIDIVPPLVKHELIKKVSFTGSYRVGKLIHEMAGLKKVTLELGSNSPNIVLDDANIIEAAVSLVRGAFTNAGQVCISVQRVYVQKEVYEQFLQVFVEKAKELKIGNPLETETDISSQITREACSNAKEAIDEAIGQGAVVNLGGEVKEGILFPTILTNVTPDMNVVHNEMFAPIVSIIPFETDEEAIAAANDSQYGLQAGVFTSNIQRAISFAKQLETGGVWINEISTYRQDNYPYGGVKQSGVGKEGVAYAVKDMLQTKFIGIKY